MASSVSGHSLKLARYLPYDVRCLEGGCARPLAIAIVFGYLGRLLFTSPALALALSAMFLLSKAPSTWGVAAHVDIAYWVISASCIVTGVPPMVMGVAVVIKILCDTARPFSLQWWHLPFGSVAFPAAILLTALARRIDQPSTYDSLRDPLTGTTTSGSAVIVFTIAVMLFAYAALSMCLYFYSEAFAQERSDASIEPDFDRVGALLSSYANRPQA